MATWARREVLRGEEEKVFDLIAGALTAQKWAELLKTPLERAAARGNRGLAQKLVRAGAEVGSALHEAVLGGHGGIVNDLLENGASVATKNGHCETVLHHAAQKGDTAIVKVLLQKGADKDALDSRWWTPLYLATFFEHEAAALALLAAGADANLRYDTARSTVVHVATRKGHAAVLKAAIENGANADTADVYKYQDTPLHEAGSFNNVAAIDVLMEAGANIAARNGSGCTPLHYAVIEVRLEALRSFLQHGVDVNTANKANETSLYYAACTGGTRGAAKMVDLLLRSGADETIADQDGIKAAEVVGSWVEEGERLAEDVYHVRELLANAPADRNWRRRGYLVLCRAHPDRAQLEQGQGRSDGAEQNGTNQRTSSHSDLQRAVRADRNKVAGEESAGDGWAGVVKKALVLQEEDIFRTIVGYL